MANLDFKNADPKKYAGIKLYGILDGMGHTIQNMYVPSSIGRALFYDVKDNTGILNLNIKNYNVEKDKGYVGLIESGNGIKMKNVNIDTMNITSNSSLAVGGIIGYSNYAELEDVTLNNINILEKMQIHV